MKIKTLFSGLFLALAVSVGAFAAEIKIATLNAYLDFSPAERHGGRLEGQAALTAEEYAKKTANLAAMVSDFDVVGLQEVGGRAEVQDIARQLGFESAFTAGKDTYTGEEVGLIWRPLAGWKVTSEGRVPALDRILSKHIHVVFMNGSTRIHVLNCHLIRPIGKNEAKHQQQIEAINSWARTVLDAEPRCTVVVMGDTNDDARRPIFTFGHEANELNRYAGTHNVGKPFDRLAVGGAAEWTDVKIVLPPYGSHRPDNYVMRLSTDHRALGATLVTR